ncbi:hypothetical protein L1049_013119 [Liquidambar formosana]|uniref:Ubiquitin-like domain-containing protein n=1 Tax=Liquidambar formosana TaxID=63359 RepID=A0AAP0RNG4_LIQFO
MFFVISHQKTLILERNPNSLTFKTLKFEIEKELGIPPRLQILYLFSKPLMADDSVLISEVGVKFFSTIVLHCPRIRLLPIPTKEHTCTKPIGCGKRPRCGEGDDANREFGKFGGSDVGLFASAEYDEEDKEADEIWESVDKRMESRRKDWRETRLKQEIDEDKTSNPKIAKQFVGLKRELYALSEQEWDSIPEIGDYSMRDKKKRSFIPVKDTLLEKTRQEQDHVIALDLKSMAAGGMENPCKTPAMDLTAYRRGRGIVLSSKLDRGSDSALGLTVVDPKGYLTDLNSFKVSNCPEISDIKKARYLLKSVTKTNPQHPRAWIAAARLEEVVGEIQAARKLINEGCEECPKNEDVWLEACRLARSSEAKAVISRGVRAIPNSVKLWMQAAMLETDDANKSRVLRKGLEHIPDSDGLWKAIVELTNEEDVTRTPDIGMTEKWTS